MAGHGYRIVSGGTDTHLFLMDVFSKGITGKAGEKALEAAGVTVNKNTIPFDPNPPMVASGIRIGTPAVTTRGMAGPEMDQIASLIVRALAARDDATALAVLRDEVATLASRFPLYASRLAPTPA
jgi:glycine hydroxymethyltransferase